MRWSILIVTLLVTRSNAQFGEIASLATSLLGSALGSGGGIGALAGAGAAGAGAASQAGGALAQIGQLYQLAQGALQLTGTGVGVLNQASEGNWFPAVLEQTAKNSQALMRPGGVGGMNLGALGPTPAKPGGAGIGPEFGTSFPAPDIDDYDENAKIPGFEKANKPPSPPDGLIDIDSGDYEGEVVQATTAAPPPPPPPVQTTTELITLFPEDGEEVTPEITTPPSRQIRIQLPDKNGNSGSGVEEELDYEDLIKNSKSKTGTEKVVLKTIDAESSEDIKRNVITLGAKTKPIVPKLDKLVEVLQKSKLSREEIDEIVSQVEGNKRIEKPPKYDFNSGVQNINEKKNEIRQKITDASRQINANLETQRKENTQTIESTVNELKVIPDLANTAIPTSSPQVSAQTLPAPSRHTQEVRSVVTSAPIAAPVQPVVQPQQVAQPQPAATNYPYPYPYQTYQTQQQQYYYHQQQPYGQQTQNYWGQPVYNQYGQPQQQYYTTQVPPATQQQQQLHQQQQQQQQNYYYSQNYQQQLYQQQQQQQQRAVQQPQPQPQPQPQQAVYQQRPVAQPQPYQQVYQPTVAPAPTQVPVQQTATATQNPNQVFHYYHDGRQIVQQIIPKQLVNQANLPLNGPFKPQNVNAVPTDQTEYLRRQRALSQAYLQPQTRSNSVVHRPTQPIAQHLEPRIYESTVTANGHSQAHAIRTYQASNTNTKTRPQSAQTATPKKSVQPPAPVRSTGRFSTSTHQKRPVMSGHVIPGPTIDHRSIQEKRTTAKPRYVRMP